MEKALRSVDEPREQRKLLVGGIGGIGKTQLAIAYAKRSNIYTSLFWLNASSDASIKDSFRSIAEQIFDINALRALEAEQIMICVHQWLSDTENRHWLLIFDGYDDPSIFKIESYYPPASHGDIVVTTRRPDSLSGMVIQVKPLQNVEESLRILETRSKREISQSDYHAKRLAGRFAGLPLALATAGAFLHRSIFTFERYLEEYENRWNIDPRRPLQLQEYQDRTLYTTWDLSYTLLQRQDPDAAKLLRLLAYFSNQSVWYELLHAGLTDDSPKWLHQVIEDEVKFDSVMRVLTDYSFLEVQTSLKAWSMHRCVHDWTLAVLNRDVDLQQYWYAFNCIAESISKDGWEFDDFRHLPYSRLATHATRLVLLHQHNNILYSVTPHYLEKVADIAGLLKGQVQLEAAEEMYQRTLAGYEKALGPDHTSTLNTVNNLANLYSDQSKLKEAEEMYNRALAGFEKALGPDHTSTLNTVNNLGVLYKRQDKLSTAEEMYKRALAGYEKALVNNLANLYSDQDNLKEAEEMYNRALAGFEKALGPDHTSTLNTVNNLGILYKRQDKLSTAEEMYLRVLAGREKALGPDHTSTLNTVNNLANLYSDQDNLKEAEEMYNRALAGFEKALGPDHTSTLSAVNNLANLYSKQGNLKQAEEMFQRALAGSEKALGPYHTSTLDTVNNLGLLYFEQGKLQEAEEIYQRALAGYEKALGPDHTSTLNTVNSLGILYKRQDKLSTAEEMYRRALAGSEKALGPDHTSTLNTVNNLGLLYSKQGNLKKAEEMYNRALAGYEKALGPYHTSTLETVNNLANLYSKQGNLKEAEEMFQRALAGYEKALGPDHTSTLDTVNNLGVLYSDQGKLKEAEEMYQRALAGYEKVLGPDHHLTQHVAERLSGLVKSPWLRRWEAVSSAIF
ncbi:hypothetical protein AnigIFM49718_002793 [Aspergillus niger]|nr:hypothetical protein AnigIFM49718_002793 [Aspergillus niger]